MDHEMSSFTGLCGVISQKTKLFYLNFTKFNPIWRICGSPSSDYVELNLLGYNTA